jgi:UDP-N-acetylglucosamine 2-epimerase (non-hydrolysing)
VSTQFHVCITLGTRPEAIKLAPIIHLFRNNPKFQTSVILTGQHREMVEQVMQLFELKADYDLDIMLPKQTLTQITCSSLIGLEKLYKEIQPNIVLVQGDTTTAFAAALAAFYQQIPVGHVEAGLRTDNLFNPFPEEANRQLISRLASWNFAPTSRAAENLSLGRRDRRVGQGHHREAALPRGRCAREGNHLLHQLSRWFDYGGHGDL